MRFPGGPASAHDSARVAVPHSRCEAELRTQQEREAIMVVVLGWSCSSCFTCLVCHSLLMMAH